MTENSVAGLLLAAGSSSRLGRPKQLIEYEGKTLIRRAAETLIEAGCLPVIVVLGAEVDGTRQALDGLAVRIFVHQGWEEGMGSSIAFGVRSLLETESDLDAILISTCDQPKISGSDLLDFLAQFSTSRASIIAAEYEGVRGVPALFSSEVFDDLLKLSGDKGARDLIRGRNSIAISLPVAAFDVDKPADL